MPDSNSSEQDSLAIIDSIINKARNQFTEYGHLYLLCGWILPDYGIQQKFKKRNSAIVYEGLR
jgi:hypothetical protein